MDEQFAIDVISGKRRGAAPALLRAGCTAGSWFYTGAVSLRNLAYDRGWLPRHRASVPVISVGNLTTGGTGKTPVTAFLAETLASRGFRPVIVSRGYRSLDGGHNDEQMVLAQLLPHVPQVRARDRVAGAAQAVEVHGCDVVLLDDGFQHRRLERDLDLLLIDAMRPWGFGRLLPRGLLREPQSSLGRADVVILTRCDQVSTSDLDEIRLVLQRWRGSKACVEAAFASHRLRNAAGEIRLLSQLVVERPLAFCGIGNPAGFQRMLGGMGVRCPLIEFSDHHSYGPGDFLRLSRAAAASRATCFVTTQKDLVKLPGAELAGLPVWAVEIGTRLMSGSDLLESALKRLPRQSREAA